MFKYLGVIAGFILLLIGFILFIDSSSITGSVIGAGESQTGQSLVGILLVFIGIAGMAVELQMNSRSRMNAAHSKHTSARKRRRR